MSDFEDHEPSTEVREYLIPEKVPYPLNSPLITDILAGDDKHVRPLGRFQASPIDKKSTYKRYRQTLHRRRFIKRIVVKDCTPEHRPCVQ
jgi:hypothetical protein